MMINSLDEVIKRYEKTAEVQERLYRLCPSSESKLFYCDGTKDCKAVKKGKNKGCLKCAKECRQFAEWLKELKRWRNLKSTISPKYRDGVSDEYNRGANDMWKEIMERIEEINTDDRASD